VCSCGNSSPFPWVPSCQLPSRDKPLMGGFDPFFPQRVYLLYFIFSFLLHEHIWSSDPGVHVPCRFVNSRSAGTLFRSDTIRFSAEQVLRSLLSSLFSTSIHLHCAASSAYCTRLPVV
jgi:hypothetical protein